MLKKIPSLPLKDILAKIKQPLSKIVPPLNALAGKVIARIPPRFLPKESAKSKLSLWGWSAVVYFLALIAVMQLLRISGSGDELAEMAVKNGQSVTINVTTGEIVGNASNSAAAHPDIDVIESGEGMAPAPLQSLTEQSTKGILPIIASDGTMPWKYYAKPYTQSQEKRPLVAIVFTHLGLSRPQTEETLKLPHIVTLGFSPYANDTGKWATRARKEGFESVVDLPIEADNYPLSDPGPFGLLEDLSPDENLARLHSVLMQFPAFVGVVAADGEKMTANKDEIKPYLTELKRRGLLFLYVKTPKNTEFDDFAKSNFFYTLAIDRVIDQDITRSAIEAELQNLIDTAKKQGYAIGLAHAYPPTITEVGLFAASARDQGVDLVPVSAVGMHVFP